MEDILNQDMINAINAVDLSDSDKNIIRSILFQERNKKDSEWDDDAVEFIIKLLESGGDNK